MLRVNVYRHPLHGGSSELELMTLQPRVVTLTTRLLQPPDLEDSMISTTLLLMYFLYHKQVSLLHIVYDDEHLLPPLISMFGGTAIAAIILTQLNVTIYYLGNPFTFIIKFIYKIVIFNNAYQYHFHCHTVFRTSLREHSSEDYSDETHKQCTTVDVCASVVSSSTLLTER
ncbi:hypothetical protein TNCV_665611 [Trichonephila clavipes]|uniref:Uncharacterized protein n=1 Tax=Trichonephila clavipes TaxID=2585209 RepID=A0A8X6VN94_TRICX|nr:hypothetical protein TNCV_665611 [Trichonephila clavipes]